MLTRILLLLTALFCFSSLTFAQDKGDEPTLAEPIETAENYKVYGSEFPDDAKHFALGYLIRNSNVFKGQKIATTGTIKQVCQKKGCFFILSDGENEARITFKDYSFFIPTDAAGQDVRLIGTFQAKKLSEEQAKYYAEDVGEDPDYVDAKNKEYGIVASSVKIMESESP